MANPNSYSDYHLHQPYVSHFMPDAMQQRPSLHQMSNVPIGRHSSETSVPTVSGLPPPRPSQGQTMFPPSFATTSFPPPPHFGQTLPPPINYTSPPPFPYLANTVVNPPQVQAGLSWRGHSPNLNTRHGHLSIQNVPLDISPGNTSEARSTRAEVLSTASGLNRCEESEYYDKNKNEGKRRLRAWLQKCGKVDKAEQTPCQTEEACKFKINKYLSSLQQMIVLISKMTFQVEKLESTMSTADKKTWAKLCTEFDMSKEQFMSMENLLDKRPVSQAVFKLTHANQKRARIKRLKQVLKEKNVKDQEVRHTRENRIDQWQRQIAEQMREEKLKKERKLSMDRTLAEVTRKIQDANRLIETMSAVEKLRLIRRDAAEKRGDSDLGESRESVTQKIEDMQRLVRGQLEVYKAEEKDLRDTIKVEYEESSKKERQEQEEKEEAKRKEEERKLYTILFGYCDDVNASHCLYPYQEFYNQAAKTLPALVQIRQDWDRYITSAQEASAIPSNWILPCPPSSDAWSAALVQE